MVRWVDSLKSYIFPLTFWLGRRGNNGTCFCFWVDAALDWMASKDNARRATMVAIAVVTNDSRSFF